MVILRKIKLINFLSHKETELSFKENTKLSIEGVSGSGKSSIVEAIVWVLYGKGRAENKNMVKRGAKFSTVILELSDGDKHYRIERGVTLGGKHTVSIGEKKGKAFVPLKHVGLRDSQLWIEKQLLKSSYTLFINSVVYPQDNVDSFIKQNALKRKELLMEIADTDNYDALYEKAREKKNEIDLKLSEDSIRIENLNNNLKEKEGIFNQMNFLLEEYNVVSKEEETIKITLDKAREVESKINEDKLRIANNEKQIGSIVGQIEVMKRTILAREDSIGKMRESSMVNVAEVSARLSLIQPQIVSIKEAIKTDYENSLKRQAIVAGKQHQSDHSGHLKALEEELMSITLSNNIYCEHIQRNCPRLEEEMLNKSRFVESQIKEIKDRAAQYEKSNIAYEKSLSEIPGPVSTETDRETLKQLEPEEASLLQKMARAEMQKEVDNNIAILNREISEQNLNIMLLEAELDVIKRENQSLVESVGNFKENPAEGLEKSLNFAREKLSELKHNIRHAEEASVSIQKIKEDIASIEKINKDYTDERECIELIRDAFGSKGIKTIVIDYLLPRLEYRINEILSKMSDFKIQLETQKSKYDGEGMVEGLFINIYNEAGECFPLANYSGGQKLKITVAISEALATMQKSKFRVFDEIFVGLDESSVEGFNDVINSLQEKFSQIFCISHLRTIQDSFEEKILVSKEGDSSKIL